MTFRRARLPALGEGLVLAVFFATIAAAVGVGLWLAGFGIGLSAAATVLAGGLGALVYRLESPAVSGAGSAGAAIPRRRADDWAGPRGVRQRRTGPA